MFNKDLSLGFEFGCGVVIFWGVLYVGVRVSQETYRAQKYRKRWFADEGLVPLGVW